MKYKWVYLLISSLVLVPGIISLLMWGLNPSIDFTGGTLLEYQFKNNISSEKIKSISGKYGFQLNSIQLSGKNSYLLRLRTITNGQEEILRKDFGKDAGEIPSLVRFETVGPILGSELLQKTFIAAILATLGILSYVAYAFKNIKYGASAVLALFHDLLVVIGTFSLLGHFHHVEVDTLFVTAVLTTMSFSVHDTIVVFDRIRETLRKNPGQDFETIANQAMTETMGRSLNNSLTIAFMLLALLLLGGTTIKWFVFALLIGTISGTYSSPFVATPILAIWNKFEEKRKQG
ncbi:MAG: protein translocase subunit SecF [Candidatus Gottesmanbacteria bacterium]